MERQLDPYGYNEDGGENQFFNPSSGALSLSLFSTILVTTLALF